MGDIATVEIEAKKEHRFASSCRDTAAYAILRDDGVYCDIGGRCGSQGSSDYLGTRCTCHSREYVEGKEAFERAAAEEVRKIKV